MDVHVTCAIISAAADLLSGLQGYNHTRGHCCNSKGKEDQQQKIKREKKKWNKNDIIPNEVLILKLLTYLNQLNVTEYTI